MDIFLFLKILFILFPLYSCAHSLFVFFHVFLFFAPFFGVCIIIIIIRTRRRQVKMDGDRCAACLSSARPGKRCEVRNAPSVIAVLSELVQCPSSPK